MNLRVPCHRGFVLAMLFATWGSVQAQRLLTEGKLTYTIEVVDTPTLAGLAEALRGAMQIVWLKGSQARLEFQSVLRSQSIIYNEKSREAVMIREASEERYMTPFSPQEWRRFNQQYDSLKFTPTGASDNINGFACLQATVKLASGKTLSVWYTNEYQLFNKGYDPLFARLEGIPVQYEFDYEEVKVRYSLQAIQVVPILSSRFDIPQTGYKLLQYRP